MKKLWHRITERFRRRYRVRIVYKSGAVILATFTKFTVTHGADNRIIKLNWTQNHWCHPHLLHITLQDIDHVDFED